jgi:hypothetical protein
MNNTVTTENQEARSGSLKRMIRRLRDSTCNEGNDGQLLEDAADELERTAAALHTDLLGIPTERQNERL